MPADGLAARVRRAIAGAPDAGEAVRLAVREIHDSSDRHDWTGVYLMEGRGELVLSHFIGEPTPHTRIPLDRGVCGAAARLKETIIVPDVAADSRYLACSFSTRSEIVVPIMKGGTVYGEIDIDSHTPDAFDHLDRRELEQVADLLAERLSERPAERRAEA